MSPVASLVTTDRFSNVSMCLRISTKCFLFPGIVPLLYSVGNKTYYYYYFINFSLFNLLRLGDTYMCHWSVSSLVQVMDCRLFSTKSSPEPMLTYCQLDSYEQNSLKFQSKFKHFHWLKCIWRCRLQTGVHFVLASIRQIKEIDQSSTEFRASISNYSDISMA